MIDSHLLTNIAGYVDGNWCQADGNQTEPVINPANGETLTEFGVMGSAETERAVAAAKRANQNRRDLQTRRQWLKDIGDALRAEKREIGRVLCLEHGKPWPEAQGEVEYAASFFDYFAEIIDELEPETLPENAKGCSWTIYHRPIGVAGLITPWNFPIGMIAKKLAPALAADCPSVIKPANETPLTTITLMQLIHERLDLPSGMVNLVMGKSSEIGKILTESPDVPMISFTGSTEVGRTLIDQGKTQVKKMGLELGGNAPFIVCNDADLDAAVDNLIANKFRGSGQTCVCANRIYVQNDVYQEFTNKLVAKIKTMRVGDGMDDNVDMGPLINRNGFDKVHEHVADALSKGATLEAGQHPDELSSERSLLYPPTVVSGATHAMRCTQEETFGPLVPLIRFETDQEVVEASNDTEFGLASYVFCQDTDRAHGIISRLSFGHCGWNTGTGPTAHAPFGGMKQSGIGREGGRDGLIEFTEAQSVPNGG
ncbi:NAD-dependent succinate-semialdehyde dehydrogenase [Salinisphaera orenii]|uniref:NAD-dependent succinate-semialdehyde dehydrogenase n=1 Tax=Salinisphaera orenii TaxID=856731 RepID=UPI000DBE90BA